jgi:hypothetical protein
MMWNSLFVILVMGFYISAAAHDDSQMIRNDDKHVVHAIEGALLAGSEVPGGGGRVGGGKIRRRLKSGKGGRTRLKSGKGYSGSKPALDPLVDEAFLTPTDPFVGGDESLLFPSSEMSAPFPNVALEEQCFNPAGVAVGPKGLQNIRPRNTFVGTIFERRGNECPCSFVSFSSSLP